MDIMIPADALSELADRAGRAATADSNPDLALARLSVTLGVLHIEATDTHASYIGTAPVTGSGGAVTVNAKRLQAAANASSGDVNIKKKGSKLIISSGRSKYSLPIGADAEWSIPAIDGKFRAVIKADNLATLISHVAHSIAEPGRYGLDGAHIVHTDGKLRAESTDGHRAGRVAVDVADAGGEIPKRVLLSPTFLTDLQKVGPDADTDVTLVIANQWASATWEDGEIHHTMAHRMIDGLFPDLDSVIPKEVKYEATFDPVEATKAIRTVAKVTATGGRDVAFRFCFRDGEIEVECVVDNGGAAAKEVVGADYSGEDGLVVGFAPRYLTDAFKAMSGDAVTISGKGDLDAATITRDGVDGIQVVMPMRLS